MRISDWSSDVCSSDLQREIARGMTKAVVDIFELVDVDEHDRGALGVALEPRHAVVNRGQEIAAVEQRRQRVALGHALQFGDRDLQYAVLGAQGVPVRSEARRGGAGGGRTR